MSTRRDGAGRAEADAAVLLLDNCTVVTMDEDRRVIENGAVGVAGDSIVAVGKSGELRAQYPSAPVRNLNGWIVMPGLVDGHVHLTQQLLRGTADELPLHKWMADRTFILEGNINPDDARAAARLFMVEMLKAGTTTFLETLVLGRHGLADLCDTIAETGMRGVLPRAVGDGGGYLNEAPLHPGLQEPPEEAITEAVEVAGRWRGSEQIKVWMGPRSTGGCEPGLLAHTVEVARSEGMGICHHYAMTDREISYLQDLYGATPVEYLSRVNLHGPDVVLVHCSGLPPDQAEALRGSGSSVIHCPASPAKMGSGVTPVKELLDAGVNVGLASDSGAANNSADLIRDFKWVSYLQKLIHHDPTVVPRESVVEMATLGGAKAVGMDHLIGSVEPGKRADLAVLRTDGPHWTPNLNTVSNLVYAASGADVDTVMVNGVILMEGREFTLIDEAAVIEDARMASERLYARTGIDNPSVWPVS